MTVCLRVAVTSVSHPLADSHKECSPHVKLYRAIVIFTLWRLTIFSSLFLYAIFITHYDVVLTQIVASVCSG